MTISDRPRHVEPGDEVSESLSRDALDDAIAFYRGQLGRDISPLVIEYTDETGETRIVETPREYFREIRGWSDETIEAKQLGWAPASRTALLNHLMDRGHDREAILGTGLFYENGLRPHFSGRPVLPYFDDNGRPAFAIARHVGHPDDHLPDAKYIKALRKDPSKVVEPIYGVDTVRDGEPVLITEGIADVITAHQAGYPCLSPVTTTFKHDDRERLLDVLADHDVSQAYVIQDAEPPSSDLDENGRLTLTQVGEGERGGVTTAAYLAEHGGIDARIGELPRAGLDKVDLDDYLLEWAGEDGLAPILASAKPASEHPAYASIPRHQWGEDSNDAISTPTTEPGRPIGRSTLSTNQWGYGGESDSALFDLSITDVAGLSEGYRGTNPLGHHGDSESYYVVLNDGNGAYDHKYKTTYTALTHLLCETGERPVSAPSGELSDAEIYASWSHAKQRGYLSIDDPTPFRAVRGAAVKHGIVNVDEFVHRDAETGRIVAEAGDTDALDAYNGDIYLGFPVGTYDAALAAIREDGFDHCRERSEDDESEDEDTDDGESREQYDVAECAPPVYDPVSVDREQRWRELRGERLNDWLARNAGTLEVFGDPPGDGKTTSVPLGFVDRNESHAFTNPTHENCHEFVNDPAKPNGYYHHKGSSQPREDCCMAAQADADENETPECDVHGHPANWPRMCPIHTRDKDDPVRARFKAIERERGTQRAHEIVDPHDGEQCAWQRSYDTLERADRVVTVHNYLTQRSVQNVGKVVVDDLQQLPIDERSVSISGLLAAANRMESIARLPDTPGMLDDFARFVRTVVKLATGGFENTDVTSVADLNPPVIPDEEIPELREYRGTNFQNSRVTGYIPGEPIARAKLAYNESVVARMKDDRWEPSDEPLCFDAVIALAIEAGLDADPACRAIAVPAELRRCPVCASALDSVNGKRICADCGWDEETGYLVHPDDERARAQARLVRPNDRDGDDEPVVEYRSLPLLSELPAPEDTLVLDATPTPEVVGALWGLDPEAGDVIVTGNEPRALNATVTQVSNGQYHHSTIARDDEYGERLRERHQRWIDRRSETCERFLVVSHKSNRRYYDLPDNAEWMHFHAARGLDRSEYDGVVVIGAPHPNVEAQRRDAELLAMHRDDLDVGGVEHSTRADAPNPPVYRKLLYEDENGEGRAVPTKHYTGLVGALFRSGRGDEIEQVAHRVRPGQADPDDEKFIDLLTNVPTDLPVDQFVRLEDLTEPLSAMLPVPEGAVKLAGAIHDAAAGEIDGVRAGTLVTVSDSDDRDDADTDGEQRSVEFNINALMKLVIAVGISARGQSTTASRSTVGRWVGDLEAVGLTAAGIYEQPDGRRYTADFDTLARALQVLIDNVSAKVENIALLARLLREADETARWLQLAERVLDVVPDADPPAPPDRSPS